MHHSFNLNEAMVPRKYRLGKRAEAMAETRARIVEAAMALYREQPVETISTQEVARRADVAPGTVLNHFAGPDALSEAVVEELQRRLRVPSSDALEGLTGRADRLRALAGELSEFFERAAPWFHVHEREHKRVEAFERGAREFDERVTGLVHEALGARADDLEVVVVRSVLSPPVLRDLRMHGGMTAVEAADVATDMLLAWLDDSSNKESDG